MTIYFISIYFIFMSVCMLRVHAQTGSTEFWYKDTEFWYKVLGDLWTQK